MVLFVYGERLAAAHQFNLEQHGEETVTEERSVSARADIHV